MYRSIIEADYSNHEIKCRLCFKPFGSNEHRVEISKQIEKKFRELFQTDLKLSEEFSKELCVVCDFQLKDFCLFKRNVILLQKGLYKFSSSRSKTINEVDPDIVIKKEFDESYESKFVNNDVSSTMQQPQSEFLDFNCDFNFDSSPYMEDKESDQVEKQRLEGDANENFFCETCNLSFSYEYQYNRHQNSIHSQIKSFDCDHCEYKSPFKLNDHMLTHIVLEDQSFQKPKTKLHISENNKWVCRHCNISFSGVRALRDHITVYHATVKPQIPCPVKTCTKVFLTTKRLRAHIKMHNDDAKEMCPECGLLLTSKHNLQKHINRVHLKLRNFFCDLCEYSSTFRHSIASHMVTHIDPCERRNWNCDICSFVSVSKQSLKAHKSYEHSGKVYTCHCGKEFNQKASLSTHIKCVHQKIKDHLCNLCGKAYFSRNDLKNHKKSQHMEKSMPCEICGKLFATQKHLTRHRLHHEEPKHKCTFEGCTKAFIDHAKLKDHKKLHEGNRDHLCHLCEKSYFHQKDLKRHLDVAHKATIFHCELCTFTISRKDYLRNHLNSAHKNLTLEQKNEILARTKVTRNVV